MNNNTEIINKKYNNFKDFLRYEIKNKWSNIYKPDTGLEIPQNRRGIG